MIEQEKWVSKAEHAVARQGEALPLTYLQSAPRRIELTPGSYVNDAKVTQAIALVLGVLSLLGLWVVGRRLVAALRARRYGVRAEAVVIDRRKSWFKINRKSRYRLICRDASGR